MFLYIVPLKQGLKRILRRNNGNNKSVFIHSSIKTRIETDLEEYSQNNETEFLYIVPLKQGLKLSNQVPD